MPSRPAGPTLVNLAFSLMLLGLAATIPRRRRLYVRHREAAVTTAHVVQAAVLAYSQAHAPAASFDAHRGSRLRLLGVLMAGRAPALPRAWAWRCRRVGPAGCRPLEPLAPLRLQRCAACTPPAHAT